MKAAAKDIRPKSNIFSWPVAIKKIEIKRIKETAIAFKEAAKPEGVEKKEAKGKGDKAEKKAEAK